MKYDGLSNIVKYKGIYNIIRVLNLQQEENCISGMKHKDYSKSREMFCVYTDDNKFEIQLKSDLNFPVNFVDHHTQEN